MPIYSYECSKCGAYNSLFIPYDKEGDGCKYCGGELYRTIEAASIIFKGDGWAKDGYNKGGKSENHKG